MSGHDLDLWVAWQRHLGSSASARAWFDSVVARHREAHRHYHDVRHVSWVVRHVEALGPDLDDLSTVIAAAFFHDAIYDPTANDNEAASARLAVNALTELDWPPAATGAVSDLILGTVDHDVTDPTPEEAVLFAADLAVLAAEPAAYADYVRNVRREYHHVEPEAWATGRAAVLTSFLERPAIYAAQLELGQWEHRARANLTAERSALRRPG